MSKGVTVALTYVTHIYIKDSISDRDAVKQARAIYRQKSKLHAWYLTGSVIHKGNLERV
jgi:hypothetical protein